jgi:hypothetical protein
MRRKLYEKEFIMIALKLTEETFEIASREVNIPTEELSYYYEDNTELGDDTYVIIDGTFEDNNRTCNVISGLHFHGRWKFVNESPTEFTKVILK